MTRPSDHHEDPQRDLATDVPHPPHPLLRLADGLDRIISLITRSIVMISGLALLLLLFANVVARYAAGGGLSFAQELPERLFPFFIVAGIALGAQRGAHMAVEAVPDLFGRGGKRAIHLLAQLCVILSNVIVAAVAFQVAGMSWIDLSPVLGLPAAYSYLALAGGSAAVVAVTLAIAIRLILIGPEALPIPNPEETGQ
ncbi:TRAP transporter small permease [Paracoccus aminovorans]|uniref:TRAP transporter small permease n=1 Tax=Paracoccus aminovorans TaxID=34004 RepID=UPI000783C75B|nr:TRAP transporter small permease [Paracoccus aminovorans]MDQ7776169.1 TRAP transporter small permease [Paracoccus aminovorans]